MSGAAQARAYANACFESAHAIYPKLFAAEFPRRPKKASVLDLGCGPCDVTMRFAVANRGYKFDAVDGSAAMLKLGRAAVRRNGLSSRIRLIKGYIPGARIPEEAYDVIISSSFLHHLHEPEALWRTVRQYSRPGTIVFIVDLRRPASRERAKSQVERYCGGEPAVLKRDFYNSLLAAFTPSEVRRQLRKAGLEDLTARIISDRHLAVFGQFPR